MPHGLDYKKDGTAAFFSVRQTAWHREGTVLYDPPTVEHAIKLAGLDFDVELHPLIEIQAEGEPTARRYFTSVRVDRDEPLGVVGDRYRPLQNREAFAVLQPLLDSGHASLETAGALWGGRDVWIMVRFHLSSGKVLEQFGKEVVPFGLLSNNHSGERGVILQETPVRVVCANTLGLARRTADKTRTVRVRHTVRVQSNVALAAEELWGGIEKRYQIVAEQYGLLKLNRLDEGKFQELVLDPLAPLPKPPTGDQPKHLYEHALERALARRNRLEHLWVAGYGHRGDRSAWEAYNGAVQSLDHDEDLWPAPGGARTASLLTGSIGSRKQALLDRLVIHCGAGKN